MLIRKRRGLERSTMLRRVMRVWGVGRTRWKNQMPIHRPAAVVVARTLRTRSTEPQMGRPLPSPRKKGLMSRTPRTHPQRPASLFQTRRIRLLRLRWDRLREKGSRTPKRRVWQAVRKLIDRSPRPGRAPW